jgi:hypothetical protein
MEYNRSLLIFQILLWNRDLINFKKNEKFQLNRQRQKLLKKKKKLKISMKSSKTKIIKINNRNKKRKKLLIKI